MHEQSLPAGDCFDAAAATVADPVDHRTALVVQLGDGSYFKAWRAGQRVSVRSLARARLFSAHAPQAIECTVARLRRKGVAAEVVRVKVIVGQTE
jgi:hypothetical protein